MMTIKKYNIVPDSITNSYTGEIIREDIEESLDGEWIKVEDLKEYTKNFQTILGMAKILQQIILKEPCCSQIIKEIVDRYQKENIERFEELINELSRNNG